ncbi:unnamed protein product [Rhizophagus irregularis]|nr:unnamed protein product [Rhizophagus irregularis]
MLLDIIIWSAQINQVLQRPIEEIIVADSTLPTNAAAQKKAVETINTINTKLAELQRVYNFTNDLEIQNNLLERMTTFKQVLHDENNKIKKLKRQAGYQQKSRAKKARLLQEHQEVVLYDSSGCLPFLTQYPNLNLNSKYNEYLSRTTLNNYLLPSRSNTKAAKTYHHPAIVANTSVSRNERNEHIDEHYCFASMKGALFSTNSIIISQDDKTKVPLGIPAVGRTFQTIQSFQEPVILPNHDFPIGMQQKLILSVYLLINLSDTNDTFCNGQLLIFIRPQYQVGTSSATHMSDLNSLTQDSRFDEILKVNGQIKPIWIILVDGGPDKNPRHMKNIYQYCRIFHAFNLDYLSIQTHAPGQSAYNPIEHSMATLSQKLADITLPINKYTPTCQKYPGTSKK